MNAKRPVPFLMYHAVADDIDPCESTYSTTPAAFEWQMRALCEEGWTTMTVGAIVDAWDRGEALPERAVAVTFDDGFSCLHENALPIMQRYGIVATAYLISGYLGRPATYDTDSDLEPRTIVSRSQVLELMEAGIEIGSHSVSHVDLRTLAPLALRDELERSRDELETLCGRAVRSFAFPRGLLDRAVHDALARVGYTSACSTVPGLNDAGTDRLALRRAEIGIDVGPSAFRTLLRMGGQPVRLARDRMRRRLIDGVAAVRGVDPMDFYVRPLSAVLAGPWRAPRGLRSPVG